MFYTYLYLLNFIPYLQIDFAQRCAYVLLVEIGPFFSPWIGFISLISVRDYFDFLIFFVSSFFNEEFVNT